MIPEVFCHKPRAELVEDGDTFYAEVDWTGGGGKKRSVTINYPDRATAQEEFPAMCDRIEAHLAHHADLKNASNDFLANSSPVSAAALIETFSELIASDDALYPADIRDPESHQLPLVVEMAQKI